MTFQLPSWTANITVGLMVLMGLNPSIHADDSGASSNTKSIDSNLHLALREVINQGAEIFNEGDHGGCYRMFQGALITARGQLSHHADVQKLIDDGLAKTETGSMGKRAWVLRKLLDEVREKINPNPKKSTEKNKSSESSPPKPQEKKPEDAKKTDDGKKSEESKKSEDGKKKDDGKKPEDSKKNGDKKPGDSKPSEKKADDKSKDK